MNHNWGKKNQKRGKKNFWRTMKELLHWAFMHDDGHHKHINVKKKIERSSVWWFFHHLLLPYFHFQFNDYVLYFLCNSWGCWGRSQKFWNYSFHCIFSIHDTCYDFNWCESETENDNDAYYANWFSLLLLFSRSRSRHIRHKNHLS